MPDLELKPEDLTTELSRKTLFYLEALMLYPSDEAKRKEMFEAAVTDWAAEEMIKTIGDGKLDTVAPQHLCTLIEELRKTRPLEALQKEAQKLSLYGITAGLMFRNLIGWNHINPTMAGVARQTKQLRSKMKFSESTVRNTILPTYKPVAHLWAASFDFRLSGEYILPRRLPSLFDFLSLAETFRKYGEDFIPKQYNKPFLDKKNTWKVPDNIPLPEIDLQFSRPLKNLSK